MEQLLVGLERVLELVLDKRWGPQRRPEDCEPLVCGGQVGVADPNVGPQGSYVWWFGASGIPYTGLALVEVDVGMLVEVGGEEVIDWADSLWWYCDMNVIKESHEVLVRCQVTLDFSQGGTLAQGKKCWH